MAQLEQLVCVPSGKPERNARVMAMVGLLLALRAGVEDEDSHA